MSGTEGGNNSDHAALPDDDEIKENLLKLVKQEIASGSLARTTNGVQSIRYATLADLRTVSGNNLAEVFGEGSWRLPVYLGVIVVAASMIGMVGIGSLMKKWRDRGMGERHHPLEHMRGTQLDRNVLDEFGSGNTYISNEEPEQSGWNDVTYVYDRAVEVSREKLDMKREASF